MITETKKKNVNLFSSYRFRLGISLGLIHRGAGASLTSGVVNSTCNRFEPPPLRFKIGVVAAVDDVTPVAVVVASALFITFNSIRSFAFDAIPAAMAEVVAVDGAAFAPPLEFVLIAIFLCFIDG